MDSTRTDDLEAIGLLEEPTRRRLYAWVVGQRRPVGREETSQALGISRSLATFHLDRLAAGGLLQTSYRRLNGRVGPGAGRPARVYERAAREIRVSLPDRRYERAAELFAATLDRIGGGAPTPELVEAAHARGGDLAGESSDAAEPGPRLLAALTDAGYAPFTDADGAIRLANCPFDAVAAKHRDVVCGANLAMAEGMVAATGAALVPVLDPRPGACCVAFRAAR
jgi:predicted ArsR family transcriptional regulator